MIYTVGVRPIDGRSTASPFSTPPAAPRIPGARGRARARRHLAQARERVPQCCQDAARPAASATEAHGGDHPAEEAAGGPAAAPQAACGQESLVYAAGSRVRGAGSQLVHGVAPDERGSKLGRLGSSSSGAMPPTPLPRFGEPRTLGTRYSATRWTTWAESLLSPVRVRSTMPPTLWHVTVSIVVVTAGTRWLLHLTWRDVARGGRGVVLADQSPGRTSPAARRGLAGRIRRVVLSLSARGTGPRQGHAGARDRGQGAGCDRDRDRQDRPAEERVDRRLYAEDPVRQDHAQGHCRRFQLRRRRGYHDAGSCPASSASALAGCCRGSRRSRSATRCPG